MSEYDEVPRALNQRTVVEKLGATVVALLMVPFLALGTMSISHFIKTGSAMHIGAHLAMNLLWTVWVLLVIGIWWKPAWLVREFRRSEMTLQRIMIMLAAFVVVFAIVGAITIWGRMLGGAQ